MTPTDLIPELPMAPAPFDGHPARPDLAVLVRPSLGAVVASRGRANCAAVVRLAMAVLVVVSHSCLIGGWTLPARLDFVNYIGVDIFFVVSGFFVAMSWERSSGPGRYLWHRALRILPGFWTCLLVTAALATLVAALRGEDGSGFWHDPHGPVAYVSHNALLRMQFFDIAGGPTGVPDPGQWDLSLWTLAWEALAYLGLALIGLAALARAAAWRWLPLGALLGSLVLLVVPLVTGAYPSDGLRFVGTFCAGTVLWTWRDRIALDGRIAAACAVVVPFSWVLLQANYRPVGLIPMAYLVMWVIYRWKAPAVFEHDLSYGFYIYAFPAGQVLALLGLAGFLATAPGPRFFGYLLFVLATVALTLPAAAASWFLVERPALSHKNLPPPRLPFSTRTRATEGKP